MASITPDVVLSTTPTLETHVIQQYLGVVAGDAVLAAEEIDTLANVIVDDIRSEKRRQTERLKLTRRSALLDAAEQAIDMGGNGIVGIEFDYQVVGTMLLVCCQGTAVLIEKLPAPGLDGLL